MKVQILVEMFVELINDHLKPIQSLLFAVLFTQYLAFRDVEQWLPMFFIVTITNLLVASPVVKVTPNLERDITSVAWFFAMIPYTLVQIALVILEPNLENWVQLSLGHRILYFIWLFQMIFAGGILFMIMSKRLRRSL